MNSRQEQYKLDQQLMRELRNGKSYETKWYIVNEIGFGDVAAVDTLLPRTRFIAVLAVSVGGAILSNIPRYLDYKCKRIKLNRNKRRCEASTRTDSTSWS